MNFSKLDLFMDQMPERGIPGCELAVSKDGKIIYRKGVGYADAAKTRPVSNQDIYWIFSATKVITCIAAMRLVEEGKICLDDPVSKYIPEYSQVMIRHKDGSIVAPKTAMTVLHLFTMTGGMTYDLKTDAIRSAVHLGGDTLDIVRAMAKDPLKFDPGTHYQYSLCHDVLAAVVEVASGMRFAEYLQKNIFDPLDIIDMGFRPNEAQKNRFVSMYRYENGTGRVTEKECTNVYQLSPDYDSGGAGLFATVDEYIKIITVIACGGKTRDGYVLLKPETIQMMRENRLCDDALNDFVTSRLYGYGWGLCGRVHINAIRSLSPTPIGEFGWDGAANAFVMIDTVNHIALYYGTHVVGCDYGYRIIHPTLTSLLYEGLQLK